MNSTTLVAFILTFVTSAWTIYLINLGSRPKSPADMIMAGILNFLATFVISIVIWSQPVLALLMAITGTLGMLSAYIYYRHKDHDERK